MLQWKHDQRVKDMARKLYEAKGIKPSCERCFYLKDPTCPDFHHICELELGLEDPEQRDWILLNLPRARALYGDRMVNFEEMIYGNPVLEVLFLFAFFFLILPIWMIAAAGEEVYMKCKCYDWDRHYWGYVNRKTGDRIGDQGL